MKASARDRFPDKLFKDAYLTCSTYQQVADRIGCSRLTAVRRLNKLDLRYNRGAPVRLTPQQCFSLIKDLSVASIEELAGGLGVTAATARRSMFRWFAIEWKRTSSPYRGILPRPHSLAEARIFSVIINNGVDDVLEIDPKELIQVLSETLHGLVPEHDVSLYVTRMKAKK